MSGRALAMVYSQEPTLEAVRALGWEADDFRDLDDVPLMPYRDFASFEEARAIAARDMPAGTTVGWSNHDGYVRGGFVAGHDVAPPLGGLAPAFILWPDHSETYVETRAELVEVLRSRLDWLVELGRERGVDAEQLETGRAGMVRGLDRIAAGERVKFGDYGPLWLHRWTIEPVAHLRWTGFRHGWDESDEPADECNHPVHYDYAGAFQDFYRDAVRSGIAARASQMPAAGFEPATTTD